MVSVKVKTAPHEAYWMYGASPILLDHLYLMCDVDSIRLASFSSQKMSWYPGAQVSEETSPPHKEFDYISQRLEANK